jgi:MFS family permease
VVLSFTDRITAVFTAYGAGAIIGNLLAGQLRDLVGSYVAVFLSGRVLAIAGIVSSFFLIRPTNQAIFEEKGAYTPPFLRCCGERSG